MTMWLNSTPFIPASGDGEARRRDRGFALIDRRSLISAIPAACPALIAGRARAQGTQERTFVQGYVTPDGRQVSVRVMAPSFGRRWGVVVFSHGANSHSTLYDRILEPWRQAGWLVLAPDHLDAGATPDRKLVSSEQLTDSRLADMQTILDQRAPADAAAARFGARIEWDALVVAGHSYGAIIAQALGGARTLSHGVARQNRSPSAKAVVAFSPPGLMKGFIDEATWSSMSVPSLVETGTADVLPGFIDDWRAHRRSFDTAPPGSKWLAVGAGVDHYFGGLICRLSDRDPAQGAALDIVVDISLDFLSAYGRGEPAALARLAQIASTHAFEPKVSLTRG